MPETTQTLSITFSAPVSLLWGCCKAASPLNIQYKLFVSDTVYSVPVCPQMCSHLAAFVSYLTAEHDRLYD